MRQNKVALACAAAIASTVAGCGGIGEISGTTPDVQGTSGPRERLGPQQGSIFDIFGGAQVGNVQFGEQRNQALAASVNRHLWQASLDTLAFLPLASTDPFSGVIATDWGAAPDTPGERFKVTAYVTSTTLDARSLRVAVFRETRAGETWAPAAVAPETPRQIEDAILVRARQLRIAERGQG